MEGINGAKEARKHVRLVTGSELSALARQDFTGDAGTAAPALLYLSADVAQVQAAVIDGSWPAIDARFAGGASLTAYAARFALDCFDRRRRTAADALEREFADELIRYFSPSGTQFDHYLVRLYANADAALAAAQNASAYALGIRMSAFGPTAGVPRAREFRVHAVLYREDVQLAVLDRIYDCFLGYYRESIRRFGDGNREAVLAASWGVMRQTVGQLLPRLREPGLTGQAEWVAVAPSSPPASFSVVGNMLAPSIPLRARGRGAPSLPLEQVRVHPSMPPQAADGLRAFLRAKGLSVRVSP